MPLTDVTARKAKFNGKDQKLFDEKGLFLLVNKSGRYWRFKYRFGGKEKVLALGVYPEVSLKEARVKRDNTRRQIADGLDPGLVRKQAKAVERLTTASSFEALAREWFEIKRSAISEGHAKKVISALECDAFPDLKSIPITEITPPMLLATLRKVESRTPRGAARLKQNISAIYRYAIQTGRAVYNPAQDMQGALKTAPKKQMLALPHALIPEFFQRMSTISLYPTIRLGLEFIILTMSRTKQARLATWDEFDFVKNEWRIPGPRMKMEEPHIVPLSSQVLSLLEQARFLSGGDGLVFPGALSKDKPLGKDTFTSAMVRLGYKGVAHVHGFRTVASTLMNEEGFSPDVIERLLAHKDKDKVRAAYNRAEYLAERRKLLQWLADFYDSQKGVMLPTG